MAKNSLNSLIRIKKREYYRRKIEEHGQDINKLYAITDNLMEIKRKHYCPRVFLMRSLPLCSLISLKIKSRT